MTENQEILEKAIQKAIDGGWNGLPESGLDAATYAEIYSKGLRDVSSLIFNHDFAKALWGEETDVLIEKYGKKIGRPQPAVLYPWKRHLQEMVIAPDPIAYLGANL